jgi:hypothetical protein
LLTVAAGIATTVAVAISGAGASAAEPPVSVGPVACAGTVQITSLAFAPSTVSRGQSSEATLQARNCTRQTQTTTTYWYGRFLGSSPGTPAGCPALDTLPRPATFAPRDSISLATIGVLAVSVLWVGTGVMRIASAQPDDGLLAVVATVAYLPPHLRHAWCVAQGRRPRGALLSLGFMAVVIVALLPVIGAQWLSTLRQR